MTHSHTILFKAHQSGREYLYEITDYRILEYTRVLGEVEWRVCCQTNESSNKEAYNKRRAELLKLLKELKKEGLWK